MGSGGAAYFPPSQFGNHSITKESSIWCFTTDLASFILLFFPYNFMFSILPLHSVLNFIQRLQLHKEYKSKIKLPKPFSKWNALQVLQKVMQTCEDVSPHSFFLKQKLSNSWQKNAEVDLLFKVLDCLKYFYWQVLLTKFHEAVQQHTQRGWD